MRARWALVGCGILLGGSMASLLALGDLRAHAAGFLWVFSGAFASYLGALLAARRSDAGNRAALAVLLAGALYRAMLVPADPTLSDDIYRYVWDGRVQAAGHNPFVHPPASAALAHLRDAEVHGRINHPDVRTIYPPAAQLLFLAARGPFDSPRGLKALFAALDVGTSILLWRLLRRRGRGLWVVAHAWNPLCIVEFAHSGHMDAWPIFLLVLAVERADAGRPAWAAAALGLSAAAKFFALALTPLAGRRWKPAWIVVPAVVALTYLPYAAAGEDLFSGLATYAASWRFNESLFALVEGPWRAAFGDPAARWLAQATVVAALGGLLSVLWWRGAPLETAALILVGAALVLSSTVYPWYVAWLVPFAALATRPGAAIAWSGTVVLSYTVLLRPPGAPWEVPWPALAAEYAVPLGVLALGWRKRRAPAGSRAPRTTPRGCPRCQDGSPSAPW